MCMMQNNLTPISISDDIKIGSIFYNELGEEVVVLGYCEVMEKGRTSNKWIPAILFTTLELYKEYRKGGDGSLRKLVKSQIDFVCDFKKLYVEGDK